MTTSAPDLSWLATFPGRCPKCLFHVEAQGHYYPCEPSGPIAAVLGREAAREGMERTTAAHPDAVALIDAAIMRRVERGETFSANTIRAELSSLQPNERNVIGARMNSLARKHCRPVGEEPSTDIGTHGKRVTRWEPKRVAA